MGASGHMQKRVYDKKEKVKSKKQKKPSGSPHVLSGGPVPLRKMTNDQASNHKQIPMT